MVKDKSSILWSRTITEVHGLESVAVVQVKDKSSVLRSRTIAEVDGLESVAVVHGHGQKQCSVV